MVGYEGDISELDMSPQNISFLCLVASILTAEYARNCKAGEKFMASQSESNDLTPHRSLDAYGEGNVSTTKNLDTLTLRTPHLYGFYMNALHSMMCRKVTLRGGISAELLKTFCESTY